MGEGTDMNRLAALAHGLSGLSRAVIDYTIAVKQAVDAAKQPGFSTESWAPLAALVDTARLERVGNFKEVMDWGQYLGFLTAWAPTAQWDCTFKRVTEHGSLVFLELEERTSGAGFSSVVNSLSLYEFDAAGRIVHVDIYLQMPLPDPAMLAGYQDVDMGG